MLVLSRKNDQAVVIGGADRSENLLRVTVLSIRNGSVRLGFEGNTDVVVHREEVWERIRAGGPPDLSTGGSNRTRPPNSNR